MPSDRSCSECGTGFRPKGAQLRCDPCRVKKCATCGTPFLSARRSASYCSLRCVGADPTNLARLQSKDRPRPRRSVENRLWVKVEKSDGCWVWTGSTSEFGHGQIWDGNRLDGTHRVSWILHNGPIPDGVCVLHHCDNPPCVRPDHLFLGTKLDNAQDMHSKGRHRTDPAHGERQGSSKLTEMAVRDILTSPLSGRALAERYGVTESAVSSVRRGKNWAHVSAEIAAKRLSQEVLEFDAAPAS